jgi:hypothetical protein
MVVWPIFSFRWARLCRNWALRKAIHRISDQWTQPFQSKCHQIFVQEINATKPGDISFVHFTWSGCDHWEHTRKHPGKLLCSPVTYQFVRNAVNRSCDGKFSAVQGCNIQEYTTMLTLKSYSKGSQVGTWEVGTEQTSMSRYHISVSLTLAVAIQMFLYVDSATGSMIWLTCWW